MDQNQKRISFLAAVWTHRSSVLVLLLANGISLIIALRTGFNALEVTLLFGVETFIVGISGFVKALMQYRLQPDENKFDDLLRFIFYYLPGFIFLFWLTELAFLPKCADCFSNDTEAIIKTFTNPAFLAAVATLFISHLYSFFYNAYDREGFRSERSPMATFYRRALLIMIYVFTTVKITENWLPATAVLAIVVGKMIADVFGHVQERRSATTTTTSLPSGSFFPPTKKANTNRGFAIGLLLTIIALVPVLVWGQYNQKRTVVTCQAIPLTQPYTEQYERYCSGSACAIGNTREKCESLDVIVDDNVQRTGEDGRGDCEWNNELNRCYAKKELAGAETPIPPDTITWRSLPGLEGKTITSADGALTMSEFIHTKFPGIGAKETLVRWTTNIPALTAVLFDDPTYKNINENRFYDAQQTLIHSARITYGFPATAEFRLISCTKEVDEYPDPNCAATEWVLITTLDEK